MSTVKIFVLSMICWLALSLQTSSAFVASSTIWPDGKATFKVNFNLSDPGADPSGDFQAAFEAALTTWTNSSTFEFVIDDSDTANPCGSSGTGSGVHFASTSCGSAFQGSTVAVQFGYFSNGVRARTGVVFNDFGLDPVDSWGVFEEASGQGADAGKIDFSRVAVHELGHSIGLSHENSIPAIMHETTSALLVPQADDLAGVASMYDKDGDGVGFANDNCPTISNASQDNFDLDAFGDACDSDIDNDGAFDSQAPDQSNGAGSLLGSFWQLGNNLPAFAQTFTVGISGDLTSVQLPIYCVSGNLQVTVRNLSGANPSAAVLDSNTFSNGLTRTNQGFVEIPLNGISVNSGDQLAITADSTGECRWTQATQLYAGGTARFSNNRTSWFALSSGTEDLPFATTVLPDDLDNCPVTSNPSQIDDDNDGVGNACDNCPITFNPDQVDTSNGGAGDGMGDACDDDDGDGVVNGDDNCPDDHNPLQLNSDSSDDGGDVCDDDDDNDGALDDYDSDDMNKFICSDDDADMCDDCSRGQYNTYNDGTDSDGDEICNLTDPNDDNDAWLDGEDNCPTIANDDQADSNENGIGNACEPGFCVPVITKSGALAIFCL
jgi:hypothetical protein